MTYEQIAEMMEEMGLPFAYHHFAEGESPAPPFLLFLSPGENTFSADNVAYFSFKQLDIELYTDKKLPELEEQVEARFPNANFHQRFSVLSFFLHFQRAGQQIAAIAVYSPV